MQRIGVKIAIDAETSNAKSQIEGLNGSIKKLDEGSRNMPRFMGSGAGSLRPGESAAIPDYRTAAQIMPNTAPNLTGQSMYGVNSFYGQTSPGGILPDGRRMPNTQFNIEQVKEQIEGLGEVIEGLTRDMQEAWKSGDMKSIANISSALENAKNTELSMRNQVKSVEREEQALMDKGDPMKQFGSYMGAHLAWQIVESFVSAGSTIMGSQKSLAGGDYAGSIVQQEKGLGQLILGAIGTAGGGLIGSLIMPGAGTLAGAAAGNQLFSFLGGLGADISERDLIYSGLYKNALPGMESFYKRFGGNIAERSSEENSKLALDWYNRASELSYGTGHTTEELMQAAQNKAAYGNVSGERALELGRQDLIWERFTGANIGNIQRMSGLAMRYGGDTDAVQRAFVGLEASGMGKGQFDEFLTSMQRIMEDGIEKGFVRGADEIAGNMTMLSKLSGGDVLWTGEQGAKRLGQMNEAMYNATNLRTIEDMISFGAVNKLLGENSAGTSIDERELSFRRLNGGLQRATLNGDTNFRSSADSGNNIMGVIRQGQSIDILGIDGNYAKVNNNGEVGYLHTSMLNMDSFSGYNTPYTDTYIDDMITLERGMRPELLAGQMEAVKRMEGEENAAGQIERYRNMFGLNYTGASKIWEMSQNSDFFTNPDKYSRQIEDIRTNTEYKSDTQLLQDAMTRLATEGINIGHVTFDKVEMPYLKEATEIMELLHQDLTRKYEEEEADALYNENSQALNDVARETLQNEDFPVAFSHFDLGIGEIYDYKGATWLSKGLFGDSYGNDIAAQFISLLNNTDASKLDDNTINLFERFAYEFYDSRGKSGHINLEESTILYETLRQLVNAINGLNANRGTTLTINVPVAD